MLEKQTTMLPPLAHWPLFVPRFFYGTAFVIGLLEIISGELETGVTRFVAVS